MHFFANFSPKSIFPLTMNRRFTNCIFFIYLIFNITSGKLEFFFKWIFLVLQFLYSFSLSLSFQNSWLDLRILLPLICFLMTEWQPYVCVLDCVELGVMLLGHSLLGILLVWVVACTEPEIRYSKPNYALIDWNVLLSYFFFKIFCIW